VFVFGGNPFVFYVEEKTNLPGIQEQPVNKPNYHAHSVAYHHAGMILII